MGNQLQVHVKTGLLPLYSHSEGMDLWRPSSQWKPLEGSQLWLLHPFLHSQSDSFTASSPILANPLKKKQFWVTGFLPWVLIFSKLLAHPSSVPCKFFDAFKYIFLGLTSPIIDWIVFTGKKKDIKQSEITFFSYFHFPTSKKKITSSPFVWVYVLSITSLFCFFLAYLH